MISLPILFTVISLTVNLLFAITVSSMTLITQTFLTSTIYYLVPTVLKLRDSLYGMYYVIIIIMCINSFYILIIDIQCEVRGRWTVDYNVHMALWAQGLV